MKVPLCEGYPNAKWEWFSEPLDCPPNEGCSPEPMVGTMSPLEGNPRPFRVGRKSESDNKTLYIVMEKEKGFERPRFSKCVIDWYHDHTILIGFKE